jgi:hypothetical protein
MIEHLIEVIRMGNITLMLPGAVASSAWVLAQLGEAGEAVNRLREGEQLIERQVESGLVANSGAIYLSPLIARPIRCGAKSGPPRDRIVSESSWIHGPCAASAW